MSGKGRFFDRLSDKACRWASTWGVAAENLPLSADSALSFAACLRYNA
jgi:hypothetical protein